MKESRTAADKMKRSASKEYSILKKFPQSTLNGTNIKTLANTEDPIEVFPPEIFFKGKPPTIRIDDHPY